ncbi:symplekin, partial [Tremellales sp. Uapishka_1]
MSLYADEDLAPASLEPNTPSSSIPTDPLQALTAALTCPTESSAQAAALVSAGQRFEEHPEKLPEICGQLLPMVVEGGESLIRSWTLEMVALAVGRSGLKVDVKLGGRWRLDAERDIHTDDQGRHSDILDHLSDPLSSTVSLRRGAGLMIRATTRPPPMIFELFNASKARILSLASDPAAQPSSVGIRAAAWKFAQKVMLAGTRAPGVDPRLQQKGSADANVGMIGRDSLLNAAELEAEANMLRTQLVTQMYSSEVPALGAFSAQLTDALVRQKIRIEAGLLAEYEAKKARKVKSEASTLGKHSMEAETSLNGAKRMKMEIQVEAGTGQGRGPEVDVSDLPVEMVIELVMSGLDVVTVDLMRQAFENARRALVDDLPTAQPLLMSSLGVVKEEDDEILNPLEMDLDDEDLLLETEQPIEEEPVTFADFSLPAPEPLDKAEIDELVEMTMQRVWISGAELAGLPVAKEEEEKESAVFSKEMWMLILGRLASRGGEEKRKAMGDFVAKDFAVRSKFAVVWLSEEWFSDKGTAEYNLYVEAILSAYIPVMDAKDKLLAAFLSCLPEISNSVLRILETLCEDPDRLLVAFVTLRDLVDSRPPMRGPALAILLPLCTHTDRHVRVMAINTVKKWVPDSAMATTVTNYALGVLRRLVPSDAEATDDIEMEDGEQADEGVESKFLQPVGKDTVGQYVELCFALSRRQQDLLDDIFRLYPKMDPVIQDEVEVLLTPLIQSLGASGKLLTLLRTFPVGSDKLALKIVTILSAEGVTPVLVSLVKGLMNERELDPRFIVPIIGELDRSEIEKQLPRIVALLQSPDNRELVKTAFAGMLTKITPADLLVALHQDEGGLKATIEAIGICFSLTSIFRSDILATALQRIVDLATLPVPFLRTIIQAVSTYKSLVPVVANNVLPKLITKKIWETPQLWDGFVKVSRLLAPNSYGALLQLPKEWLKDVVEKQPALKVGLKGFLQGKPAGKKTLAEIFGEDY